MHGSTVLTRAFTKSEYVNLIPPLSTSDYEGLKASIKEHNGLLMPIILNQSNVVLDGHHRLRACTELGIPASYTVKTFEDPLDELKYVVTVNIRRRHLDEFQRAEVAIKYDKLYKKIARDRYTATQFNSKTAQAAVNKRYPQMPPEEDGEDDQ
ncbi:MAG TPA: ParB N-terminal domain-containing protein, partial [Ktedonobacteraceae bacterium]|nr:ParB N-terminal domain-containing protein [Ktedonobacteraceae bacterium]